MTKSPDSKAQIKEFTDELGEHVKLIRDYATTPGNVWLARGELNKASRLLGEIELILDQIKQESSS